MGIPRDLGAQSVLIWSFEIADSRAVERVEGHFLHLATHMSPRRLIAEPSSNGRPMRLSNPPATILQLFGPRVLGSVERGLPPLSFVVFGSFFEKRSFAHYLNAVSHKGSADCARPQRRT